MCSRLRSEVRLLQCVRIHACSMSWLTVARSAGSFFRQQATKSLISALAPQPAGKVGGSSLTILFIMSQYLQGGIIEWEFVERWMRKSIL